MSWEPLDLLNPSLFLSVEKLDFFSSLSSLIWSTLKVKKVAPSPGKLVPKCILCPQHGTVVGRVAWVC